MLPSESSSKLMPTEADREAAWMILLVINQESQIDNQGFLKSMKGEICELQKFIGLMIKIPVLNCAVITIY